MKFIKFKEVRMEMFGIEAISQDLILNVIALILNSSKVNIYLDHCTGSKDFTG